MFLSANDILYTWFSCILTAFVSEGLIEIFNLCLKCWISRASNANICWKCYFQTSTCKQKWFVTNHVHWTSHFPQVCPQKTGSTEKQDLSCCPGWQAHCFAGGFASSLSLHPSCPPGLQALQRSDSSSLTGTKYSPCGPRSVDSILTYAYVMFSEE